jgi:hypothetical protein
LQSLLFAAKYFTFRYIKCNNLPFSDTADFNPVHCFAVIFVGSDSYACLNENPHVEKVVPKSIAATTRGFDIIIKLNQELSVKLSELVARLNLTSFGEESKLLNERCVNHK